MRWLERLGEVDLGGVETLGLAGHGRVRLGPLPWLPIDHRTVHRLGRDQVRDIRLRLGPVPVLRVLDAYVDGRGITKVGPFPQVGPAVDQGAFLSMWAEALAWPAGWQGLPGLRWEPIDDERARLVLPFQGGIQTMDVTFDRETTWPRAFETDRFKTLDRKVRWRAECFDWRSFGSISTWSHVTATWADDARPWYEAWFDRVALNPPVERAIGRANAAIARAAG